MEKNWHWKIPYLNVILQHFSYLNERSTYLHVCFVGQKTVHGLWCAYVRGTLVCRRLKKVYFYWEKKYSFLKCQSFRFFFVCLLKKDFCEYVNPGKISGLHLLIQMRTITIIWLEISATICVCSGRSLPESSRFQRPSPIKGPQKSFYWNCLGSLQENVLLALKISFSQEKVKLLWPN